MILMKKKKKKILKEGEVNIPLPKKMYQVFRSKRGDVRYRAAYGGRGSAKSFSFARMAAIYGYGEPLRILCTREFQSSIKESFHAEVKNAILSLPWLAKSYNVGIDYIRGNNGTEFIFRGLKNNTSAIKSMAQIDICIIEEAEQISENSWLDLEPTIRAPKSEIWAIWNPKREDSPVDKRFRKFPPSNAAIAELNYNDNPWFPSVLDVQRLRDRDVMSPGMYRHIWEGKYLKEDESCIFANKWGVADFTPEKTWNGPYFGLDFGFSQDPTAAVKVWIYDSNLYVEYDCGSVGLELDDTAEFVKNGIPGMEKHVIRADCSRPESISFLKRNGLPRIVGCEKGKGSVEDGIAFMRSHTEIIVHPRCVKTQEEMGLYSYKVDRITGDILPSIVDAYNHFIDAIRYALEPAMKRSLRDYSKLVENRRKK